MSCLSEKLEGGVRERFPGKNARLLAFYSQRRRGGRMPLIFSTVFVAEYEIIYCKERLNLREEGSCVCSKASEGVQGGKLDHEVTVSQVREQRLRETRLVGSHTFQAGSDLDNHAHIGVAHSRNQGRSRVSEFVTVFDGGGLKG